MVANPHDKSGRGWLWEAGFDRVTVCCIGLGFGEIPLNGIQETKHFACFCAHLGKGKPFLAQIL